MLLATVAADDRSPIPTAAAVGDDAGWVLLDIPDVSTLVSLGDWEDLVRSALAGTGRLRSDELRLLTPLPRPAKVLCCGLNYRDHIVETGREMPAHPTLFAKFADTLTSPHADIPIHSSDCVDWEAELVVVIGEEIHRADRDRAAQAILGYTVANDISLRDWQRRTLQWLQGKAFDATTPVGPVVITADAFDPAEPHAVQCTVNGRVRQASTTAELVFDCADLVSYVSQFTRLLPGDLILTGTPGGVALGMDPPPFLQDGDVVVTSIDGIGELRNTIRFESPTHPGDDAADERTAR